jgi:hypothetical protein
MGATNYLRQINDKKKSYLSPAEARKGAAAQNILPDLWCLWLSLLLFWL